MPSAAPQPAYAAPPAKPRSSKKWLIAAGIALACVVAAVVAVVLAKGGSGTDPTPAQPSTPTTPLPTLTPTQLKSVLLSAEEITAVMGATEMTASDVYTTMGTGSITISDEDCMGAAYTAQASVYNGTGWSAVSDQTLKQPRAERPTDNSAWVDQTAVTFPSDDQARAFLENSADNWKGCAGKTVTVTGTNSESTWTFGDLTRDGDTIAQLSTQEGASGWACQHTMTAFSNAVFEAIACSDQIGDEATRITEHMVVKAQG
jgi:serine/threonine-protein kinase